jgi:hypothetical protein
MEGLRDVNIRSAQTLTRDSRVDHSVKSNIWHISEILQRRPLPEDRRLIEPVQSDKDGPCGGPRSDLVWRDPRPVKSNVGQRFVRFNHKCAAPIDDFLIVQIRSPLRQNSPLSKIAIRGTSDDELVINLENA